MVNIYNEELLCQISYPGGPYCILRDKEGHHLVRRKSMNGTELFPEKTDKGKKNQNKERVYGVFPLYELIETLAKKNGA